MIQEILCTCWKYKCDGIKAVFKISLNTKTCRGLPSLFCTVYDNTILRQPFGKLIHMISYDKNK